MERKPIYITLFPTACMTALTLTAFVFPDFALLGIDLTGLFEIALMVLFPLLFALQGVLCALFRVRLVPAVAVSLLDFAVLGVLLLSDAAMRMMPLYAAAELLCWTAAGVVRLHAKRISPPDCSVKSDLH